MKIEITLKFDDAAIETLRRLIISNQAIHGKKVKYCKNCGNAFDPKSNNQKFCCVKCKIKSKEKKKKDFSALDETLEEIENKRKLRESEPYKFEHETA